MNAVNYLLSRSLRRFLMSFTVILLFLVKTTLHAEVGDSIKYLTAKDTLFITLDETTGEKIFEHRIVVKQTLYSLARFYGLNEEELYPYNPKIKNNIVNIGQRIRVPIPNGAIKRFKGDNFKQWKYAPIVFLVKKGDNLFKIAQTLFHMPIDSVVKWNNLPNRTIQPGQLLHVGWMSLDGVGDTIRHAAITRPNASEGRSNALSSHFEKQKKSAQEQRGAAFWNIKGNTKTDLYCLHRTAKVGSIIAITSTMNNKTAYAKVIGKIPENAHGTETVLIVAPSVAKMLGAKDEKFFVKIRYSQ
jgi:LysM repeat protein